MEKKNNFFFLNKKINSYSFETVVVLDSCCLEFVFNIWTNFMPDFEMAANFLRLRGVSAGQLAFWPAWSKLGFEADKFADAKSPAEVCSE